MIVKRDRRVENRLHGVADKLAHHATVLGHDRCGYIEICIEQRHKIGRIGTLGHARETLDVGEQRSDFPHLALQPQGGGVGGDPPNHVWRKMLFEACAQQPGVQFIPREPRQHCGSESKQRNQ